MTLSYYYEIYKHNNQHGLVKTTERYTSLSSQEWLGLVTIGNLDSEDVFVDRTTRRGKLMVIFQLESNFGFDSMSCSLVFNFVECQD